MPDPLDRTDDRTARLRCSGHTQATRRPHAGHTQSERRTNEHVDAPAAVILAALAAVRRVVVLGGARDSMELSGGAQRACRAAATHRPHFGHTSATPNQRRPNGPAERIHSSCFGRTGRWPARTGPWRALWQYGAQQRRTARLPCCGHTPATPRRPHAATLIGTWHGLHWIGCGESSRVARGASWEGLKLRLTCNALRQQNNRTKERKGK